MEPTMNVNMHLYEKLATLQHLLMRRRFARKGASPLADPMRGQGRILALLKIKDGVSTKDMSSVLGIRTSSLNELLSKLESKGYIVREQSEEDKRVMVVKLTEKGREVEQPSGAAGGADMFDCLSDDEKNALGEYLDRMIAHVSAEIGDCSEDFEAMARNREKAFRKFFADGGCTTDEGGFPPFEAFGPHAGFGGFDPRGGGRHGGGRHQGGFGRE
ncbi:MarR family winged helix-turn-helix transcriptional regulator [Raoultibacter massiliensis]|uniref:MarR family transcriptional regulator n=1 Tax=Raoultibacter massiliensis TaxID=1852371 RepID=A0ABV1JG43_9ACTN|nr:MarR family transcriptional regulator [Raoultibacter massiliensis]